MSELQGDQIPSLLNAKNLTKNFYTLVPNTFFIFSISLILMLILYSNKSFEKKPYDMFCFTKDHDSKSKKTDPNCPPMEKLDGTDIGTFGLYAFVFSNAYRVTLNATNSVIHLFLKQIQKLNIIRLYIFFFFFIKYTKELVRAFFPFNLFKKIKNTNTSIFVDFMSIFMSVIGFLFTICLLVAIVVYFAFIFYRLGTAKRNDAKLIPVLFVLIIIFPIIAITFGLNATITENGVGVTTKQKIGHYNWFFFVLIALGAPFIATCQTIGSVLISGVLNLFTKRYEDKDAVNQYPMPDKVGGGINSAVEAVRAVEAVIKSKSKTESKSEYKSTSKSVDGVKNPLLFNTEFNTNVHVNNDNSPNDYFITKANKIRSTAVWGVLGLTLVTTILTMLDVSVTTLKWDHSKKIINKTILFLL
jgi:hypothetical protein